MARKTKAMAKKDKAKANKAKYDMAYRKANCKRYTFDFNYNTEGDVIEFLESKANKKSYLKNLIRKDMMWIVSFF